MRKSKASLIAIMLITASSLFGGCAGSVAQTCLVEPLRHPEIRFDDKAHRYIMADHVFFSKEGSSRGAGVAGGGCGCN
jgi:hypothetical protein